MHNIQKLFLLTCVAASSLHAQQSPDTRQVPLQVVSGGATLLGLKAMLSSAPGCPAKRLIIGSAVTAGGLIGLLYPRPVLKKADLWNDLGNELYYAKKLQHYGVQSSSSDWKNYAYYKGKNLMQGNNVPHWIHDLEKKLDKLEEQRNKK
jgi:hypothetical protein